MKQRRHSVRLVTDALLGRLPDEADWPTLLQIANRGWLVPALYVALRHYDQLHQIPPPVSDYLSFLHSRNCERNLRLRRQLLEATTALNAAGVEPILLKGAVHLFTAADDDLGARMLSDLDISVGPVEMARTRSALGALGYEAHGNARELARTQDAAVIELHDRPSARSARYLTGDLKACSPKTVRDGAVARIPSATARSLHLLVHDMIKEGDYWSFKLDLRHLYDLAGLARSEPGVDWQTLSEVLSDGVARDALAVQARALEDLFAIEIPAGLCAGRQAQHRHSARLICASGGPAAPVVRLVGNLSCGVRKFSQGYTWAGGRKFGLQVSRQIFTRGSGSRV